VLIKSKNNEKSGRKKEGFVLLCGRIVFCDYSSFRQENENKLWTGWAMPGSVSLFYSI